MTSDHQRDRDALETRIQSLSKEKRELLTLLLQQEQVDNSTSTMGQSPAMPSHDSLVAIQPFGGKPPLFCLPPVFGTVFTYYNLVSGLGPDQPVYAVRPRGIHGEAPPHTRVADMATHAVEAIRTVQPAGPYHLAGYSFGGVIAFEVAQQLRAAGEPVGLVALIDTWAPMTAQRPGALKAWALSLELMSRGWLFVFDYIALLIATRSRTPSRAHRESNHLLEGVTIGVTPPAIRPMLRVYLANVNALRHYAPQPYSHRLTFFRSGKSSRTHQRDPTRGWSAFTTEDIEVHWLLSNHISIMRRPHVQVLAKTLSACLQQI